jgi:hypothetical protein
MIENLREIQGIHAAVCPESFALPFTTSKFSDQNICTKVKFCLLHGCKTYMSYLRGEHRLSVTPSTMLRKIL